MHPLHNRLVGYEEADDIREVEIFLELAQTYRRRKKVTRIYPEHFTD